MVDGFMVRAKMLNIWRRAETGPIVPVKKFELDIFFPKVQQLVKEYDLHYDSEQLVPTDNSLINDLYKAGTDLFLDVGVLCTDTERQMLFEEDELKEMLRNDRKGGSYWSRKGRCYPKTPRNRR
jgi:methylamine--corrinoid protein Co-methyltransferase